MSAQDVWEALEATTQTRRAERRFDDPAHQPNRNDIALAKKAMLRFLEEIDGDLTVADVREALDEYRSDWRNA